MVFYIIFRGGQVANFHGVDFGVFWGMQQLNAGAVKKNFRRKNLWNW